MRSKQLVPALAALFVTLATDHAAGQALAKELPGSTWYEAYGWASVSLGDVSGDGIADFAVAAPRHMPLGTGAGRVRLYSGADFSLLWVAIGTLDKGDFGYALADVGDLDGDGKHDLLVGAPDLVRGGGHAPASSAGYAEVRSGASGALIHHMDGDSINDMFGTAVTGLGDVDGDSIDDFAVGAVGDDDGGDGAGSVRIFSGVDASIVTTLHGNQVGAGFGGALASMGDLGSDGMRELLVGAPSHDGNGEDSGAVFLFAGSGGPVQHTWFGPEADAHFGGAIAGLDDLDLDSVPDVAIGAVEADGPVSISAGALFVYSGANKLLRFSVIGQQSGAYIGRSVCDIGDITGDGRADLAVGASVSDYQDYNSGHVMLLSGRQGEELGRVYGKEFEYLGTSVALLGDLGGDGMPEFAVGGINSNYNQKGVLRVYSTGDPMPPSTYCTGKLNSQGCTPELSSQGTPTLTGADDFVVVASDVINKKVGLVIWSRGADAQHAFNATLCLAAPIVRTAGSWSGGNAGPDDCSGTLSFHFTHDYMTQKGIEAGTLLHAQAWYRDPGLQYQQAGFSQALMAVIAP